MTEPRLIKPAELLARDLVEASAHLNDQADALSDEFAAVLAGPTTIATHGGTSPYSSSGRVELVLRAMAVFSLGHRLGSGATLVLDDLEQHGTEGIEHGWAGLDALHVALMSQPAPFILVADIDSNLHARTSSLNADVYRLSAARARTFGRALPASDRRRIRGDDDASMMPLWRDGEIMRGSIARRGDEFVMLAHQPAGFEHWCTAGEPSGSKAVELNVIWAHDHSFDPLRMARETGESVFVGQTDPAVHEPVFVVIDRRDDPPITLAPTRAGSGRPVRPSDFITRPAPGIEFIDEIGLAMAREHEQAQDDTPQA